MGSEFMDDSAANGVSCASDDADEAILGVVSVLEQITFVYTGQ